MKLAEWEVYDAVEELQGDAKAAVSAGGVFCANWPKARTVLNLIKQSVSNTFVRIAANIILQIGNTLYKQSCTT